MNEKYKLRLLADGEEMTDTEHINIIKELDQFPAFSTNLDIEGKIYRVTDFSIEDLTIGVRAIEYKEKVGEVITNDYLTCPYCGFKDLESSELPIEGRKRCDQCGSEIDYIKVTEVKYIAIPYKWNRPIQLT